MVKYNKIKFKVQIKIKKWSSHATLSNNCYHQKVCHHFLLLT